MRRRTDDADAVMLDRAALRLGLQAAMFVVVAIVAAATALGLLVLHEQHADAESLLHRAAATADDVDDPPAGMWLVIEQSGVRSETDGLPGGLPDDTDLLRAEQGAASVQRTVREGGRHLEVLTQPRPGGAVQAVLDLGPQDALRRHVLVAIGGTTLAGLLIAAAGGSLLARRAVRPLAATLRLQRTFVADASHELRTPLTLLSTRAQLLRAELAPSTAPATVHDVDGVVADVRRLTTVVDDLLLAADPRRAAPTAAVDLGAVSREVLDSAHAFAAAQQVELRLDTATDALADASEPAVRRAVLALVDNAIRHTPRGGRVMVAVVAKPRPSVTVTDTGPGLDAADAEHAFRRFSGSSGPDAGSVAGGSRPRYGLGLALVRDIAARYGGEVRIVEDAARPGAGTPAGQAPSGACLRLSLPAARPARVRWRRLREVVRLTPRPGAGSTRTPQ